MSENIVNLRFYDFHPPEDNFKEDVLKGLHSFPRSISPKYFYDEQGSNIFDQITTLEDYYPTRCEMEIFEIYGQAIASRIENDCVFIEPGAGNGNKARIFLKLLKPAMFIPIDISKEHLKMSAKKIAHDFTSLNVYAVCSDFTSELNLPDNLPDNKRVVFFPGSSIGNFQPHEAIQYLTNIAYIAGKGGQLLIGVDLKKDIKILERAYDDVEGVTAQFNLNLLARMNRELSSDFDLDAWKHMATYNELEGRIEMHLCSQCPQVVTIDDSEFFFEENECIHTENSYKYSIEEFQKLAKQAGFDSQNVWLDQQNYFSVHLLICK